MQLKTLITLLLLTTTAFSWEDHPKIAKLFKDANIQGTFLLYDVTEETFTGYNQPRAETRYIPASTFKIANSLIGLSTGVVKSVDEVLPYTGPDKPFIAAWKEDMGLRKAIAISNVPIYQELARRIGLERMEEGLETLQYGNRDTGEAVDRFWLDGPLRISAVEQVQLLARLVQNRLPLSKKTQESVREILLLETGPEWKLYGKTGWQNAPGQGVGWFVGWVEQKGRRYVFALNLDITAPADAAARTKLSKASLRLLGLM